MREEKNINYSKIQQNLCEKCSQISSESITTQQKNSMVTKTCWLFIYALFRVLSICSTTHLFLEELAIPKSYNKYLIPKPKDSALNVTVQLFILSFGPVDDQANSFEISYYYRQLWNDTRLTYNESYGELDLSASPNEFIWTPDIVIANAIEVSSVYKEKYTKFTPHGEVLYSQRLSATVSCILDFHLYPFDKQTCYMRLESYAYNMEKLNPFWNFQPIVLNDVNNFPMSPGYDISKYATSKPITLYSGKAYASLQISFELERPLLYYLFQTFVPSILLMIMNLASYWIPHTAIPARVALIITTFLSNTIILQKATEMTPKLPFVNPMQLFLLVNTIFIVMSLIQFAMVLSNDSKNTKKKKQNDNSFEIPSKYLVTPRLNKVYYLEEPTIYDVDSVKGYDQTIQIYDEKQDDNKSPGSWENVHIYDKHARVVMPLLFICFSIVYWFAYLIFVV